MIETNETLNAQDAGPAAAPVRAGRLGWQDFRLALIGAVALVVLIAAAQWLWFLGPVRLVLGLAYMLYVPGYCLTAALFPREDDIDGIERVGLSLGLSIAWITVLALFLDALPWGLRLWPIVVGELVSIGLFSAAALWRRSRLPADEAYAPAPAWQPRGWWRSRSGPDRRIYQFIAVALLLVTAALAWTFLVPTPDEFMTEFYMLGKAGQAEDFPRQAAVGEEIGVTLGVANQERAAHTYRVEVWAADPFTEGRRQRVAQDGPFDLAVGQSRAWPITWRMPWPGDNQVVELLLFDGAGTEPYRSLRLWLNVKE